MKKRLLSLMFVLLMTLVFVPNYVNAATKSITVKPKDKLAEYNRNDIALVPTEFEVIGDLVDGDVVTDVTYSGSQLYTGSSESSIESFKIMRGNVEVTSEYQVTRGKGTLTVITFGMPEPTETIDILVGDTISKEELEILLGVDGLTAQHSGVGNYTLDDGFTSDTVGTAKLVYNMPGVDKNNDGQFEFSPFKVEIEITVVSDSSLLNYNINVENGTAIVNDNEQYRAKVGDTITLNSIGAPEGQEFDKWEITGVTVTDLTKGSISFVMPSNNVTAKALYKNISSTEIKPYDFIDDTKEQEFETGKLSEYVIKINADHEKFESLSIDGQEFIKDEDYVVTKGSTIITFTEKGLKKLNSLSAGEHEIAVNFVGENNPVIATLKINAEQAPISNIENPKTFDGGVFGYVGLTIIALVGIIGGTVIYRKKQTN